MSYQNPREEIAAELAAEFPDAEVLKGARLPAVPTRGEVTVYMQSAKVDPRDYLISRIFYASGIRLGELVALLFADVLWDERALFVRSGKGDKDRYALLDTETLALLRDWQGTRGTEAPLFDIEERAVQRAVEKYAKQTGLYQKYLAMDRSFSPHSFRHAFATHCYENGMDLFTLKRLMGHEYLETTEIYIATGLDRWRVSYDSCHEWEQKDGP